MSFLIGAALLAIVTALACALPGVFVVLRRESMLVDAISHAVLPGIVLGYAFTHDLRSPWLVAGAAAAGLLVVLGADWLRRTGLIAGDAPIGLVFPALFALGVILVSSNFAQVHLDTHAVLVGDLNLAALGSLEIGGVAIGPRYLYLMAAILALNILVLGLVLPALTAATFDPAHARSVGIPVAAVTSVLMILVALTVTAAFHAAGAVLVLALIVAPAATAQLLTRRLGPMIALTAAVAVGVAGGGFWVAYLLDLPTSAAMAVGYGLVFLAAAGWTTALSRRPRPRPHPAPAAPAPAAPQSGRPH